MTKIAVFTGAGASKAVGFPLTAEIMPQLRRRLLRRELFGAGAGETAKHRRLREYLCALLPGFERTRRLPSITDVLSLIDYSIQSQTALLRGRTPAELRECRQLLDEALFHILKWPYNFDDAPRVLDRFADWLHDVSTSPGNSLALISSNYDIAIEERLFRYHEFLSDQIAKAIDFGFAWRDPREDRSILHARPAASTMAVYKLHGSLNWLRCDACEHTFVNPNGVIAHQAFRSDPNSPYATCHCDHRPLRQVIVAPSLVRDVQDVNLREVWKASLEWLRQAERWIIIGYSFPPEDLAIRSLFIRAYGARARPPRVQVVLPSFNSDVTSRYRVLFPRFAPVSGGLRGFVSQLKRRDKTRQPIRGGTPPGWARS
jgi:hypothetical protein